MIDESGFSLIPLIKKTWGIKGKTPQLIHSYKLTKYSAISGVTPQGKIYFQLTLGSVNSEHVVKFLKHLLIHINGKIVCLWDNGSIHRSESIKKFLIENRDRLIIFHTPPYSPEYNADEDVWDNMKYMDMGNYCPRDLIDLKKEIRKSVMRLRSKPHLIKSFFEKLPYKL